MPNERISMRNRTNSPWHVSPQTARIPRRRSWPWGRGFGDYFPLQSVRAGWWRRPNGFELAFEFVG